MQRAFNACTAFLWRATKLRIRTLFIFCFNWLFYIVISGHFLADYAVYVLCSLLKAVLWPIVVNVCVNLVSCGQLSHWQSYHIFFFIWTILVCLICLTSHFLLLQTRYTPGYRWNLQYDKHKLKTNKPFLSKCLVEMFQPTSKVRVPN